MYKCNFLGCNKHLSVENREVHFIRLEGKRYTLDNGDDFYGWAGFYSFCGQHEQMIYRKKLPRDLKLVYEKKGDQNEHKN